MEWHRTGATTTREASFRARSVHNSLSSRSTLSVKQHAGASPRVAKAAQRRQHDPAGSNCSTLLPQTSGQMRETRRSELSPLSTVSSVGGQSVLHVKVWRRPPFIHFGFGCAMMVLAWGRWVARDGMGSSLVKWKLNPTKQAGPGSSISLAGFGKNQGETKVGVRLSYIRLRLGRVY